MAAMENLINSARGRGVVFLEIMPAAAGVYLDNIINRVIETPRDKAIIDAEKVAPADRERRCQLEARILREMTRQPVNVSADLLRLLASNNLSIRR
jgi:hypothetical protein